MPNYFAYGLCIASEIPLPELPRGSGEPDIFIRARKGGLPSRPSELPATARLTYESVDTRFRIYEVGDHLFWFRDGVGTLRIRNGREIDVRAREGATRSQLRAFVLGPGLRSLLVQQGHLVFHASATVIDGLAVMFVGESGSGKSTTAAAFHSAGHQLLTDDVTPVLTGANSRYVVPPGFGASKLDPLVARRFTSMEVIGERDGGELGRRYFVTNGGRLRLRYPLERVYVLRWADEISIDPLSGDVLTPLLRGSYRLYDSTDVAAFATHFSECAAFADSVPIRSLSRPSDTERLDDIVSFVESDVRG